MLLPFTHAWRMERRMAYRAQLSAHNQQMEANVRAYLSEQAHKTAEGLMENRGNKLRKNLIPDKEALAAEIEAHRTKALESFGNDLLKAYAKSPASRSKTTLDYTPLTLGFTAYMTSQALKGPLAAKHRLGSWAFLVPKVFGNRATLNFEAKRYGRFCNQLGIRRFFNPHAHSVMLAGLFGNVEHLMTLPSPMTKLVLKLAKFVPVLPKIYGWASGHMHTHMARSQIGSYAAYGMRLSLRPGFPARQQPAGNGHASGLQSLGDAHGAAAAHGGNAEQPGHAEDHGGHADAHAEEHAPHH